MGAELKSMADCGKIGEGLVARGINSDQRIPESTQLKPGFTLLTRGNGRGIINMNIPTSMALYAEMSDFGGRRTLACRNHRPEAFRLVTR